MRDWRWPTAYLFLVGAGGVALYLAGLREILVFGLLLLCPLLHLAMIGRHQHAKSLEQHKHG